MQGGPELSDCIVDGHGCILQDRDVRSFLSERNLARVFDFAKGDRVFEAKRKVVGFYLICEGIVREISYSSSGEKVTLSLFKRGNVLFGDDFFLDENYRETTAVSVTSSKVLMIEREAFPELMSLAGRRLGRKIAMNKRRLRRRLELAPCSVLESIAFWLMRLISDSGELTISISNKELADIVGCSPVTLSRKLGELQEKGMIDKSGRELKVTNRKGLEDEIVCVSPS